MKRFGLRAVLLMTSLVALVLSQIFLQSQNVSLRSQLKKLQTEVGYLNPEDTTKVNIILVPSSDRNTWRWRIFVPPGTCFDAGIRSKEIPVNGVPNPDFERHEISSDPNGVLITASVTKDIDSNYLLKIDLGNGNILFNRTDQDPSEFLDGSASLWTAGAGGAKVCEFDEPIILHRRRLLESISATTKEEPTGPARGVLFWITPRKKH